MTKTKQRRTSAYHLGKRDAQQGRHFRWARHPQYVAYKRGYRAGGGVAPGDKPRRPWRRLRRFYRLCYRVLFNAWHALRGSRIRIGYINTNRNTPNRMR